MKLLGSNTLASGRRGAFYQAYYILGRINPTCGGMSLKKLTNSFYIINKYEVRQVYSNNMTIITISGKVKANF